jgi:aminoglycoside phosphotransferase (APT) family kinase protein
MMSNHRRSADFMTARFPKDEVLPGLGALLDVARLNALIAEAMGTAAGISDARISYVRYKPGTSCIVACSARGERIDAGAPSELIFYGKCYLESDFAAAARKAETRRWIEVMGVEAPIVLPDLCVIIYLFPNDSELRGLALAANPKKVQRILYEHVRDLPGAEWRISDRRLRVHVVRYKPEKRTVIRVDTRATNRSSGERKPLTVYMRSYHDDRGEQIFRLLETLRAALRTVPDYVVPQPLVYLRDKQTLFMEGLSGDPLLDRLMGKQGPELVARTAESLAALHRVECPDLARRSFDDVMADVRATGTTLGHLLPEAADDVEELLDRWFRLGRSDEDRGFVHGDFHHGQVLVRDGGVGLLDFDRSYLGDVTADVGNFCAHLRLLEQEGRLREAGPLSEVFVQGYERAAGRKLDRGQLDMWTAIGLLQLAVHPFRTMDSDWKTKSLDILTASRECMR